MISMNLQTNGVKLFFSMCATRFVIFVTTNPYINRKSAYNDFSNSLSCTVHVCLFFFYTVYLHKMRRRNRIPVENRERIVRAFEDKAEVTC